MTDHPLDVFKKDGVWYADYLGSAGNPDLPPEDGDWGAPGHAWATASGPTRDEAVQECVRLAMERMRAKGMEP